MAGVAKKAAAAGATVAAGGGPEDPVADAVAARQATRKAPADRSKAKKPTATSRGKRALGFAWSGNRRLLVAEFVACMLVLGLGTVLVPKGKERGVPRAMVKASALCGVFLILALVASSGKASAKAATAVGTLITAGYVLTSADVHDVVQWVQEYFSKTGDVTAKQPAGSVADTTGPGSANEQLGGTTGTTGPLSSGETPVNPAPPDDGGTIEGPGGSHLTVS